jgi:Tfp pilus assembly protein FimT
LGDQAGWSLSELIVTCLITGIVAGLTIPWTISAVRAFNATRGAREIQAALNQARAVAITTRQNICFQSVAGGYAYRQGTCAGTAWVGLDTTSTGTFRPSSRVTLTGTNNPVFTPFGTANQTAVITVTSASGTSTTVTVQPSGRVTIP